MTAEEAIAYIEHQGWSSTRLGLDRTRALLAALGDPQRALRFIHVAGSNGKGSTCAMLESILRAAGHRTGLYISPHIQDFTERIQADGLPIPREDLARLTARVRPVADAMADHPSQFELVTAIAMLYFLERRCDIVVLEVGMGGALDSTNVIDAPEVAILTNIGLEHTEYLGNTLEEIAATKAGIVKPGCACVAYDGAPAVTDLLRDVCTRRGIPFHPVRFSRLSPLGHTLVGQRFDWDGQTYSLPLLGRHQLHNAATALTAVEVLVGRGWSVPTEAVRQGLAAVKWPARAEVLSAQPLFLLDGGHNPQCAQALRDILEDYLPGQPITFLMGVLADKDWRQMAELVLPRAARFLCLTPDSPRALPAGELADWLRSRGADAAPPDDASAAIAQALDSGGPAVAFGSLYMAGQIRDAFPAALKQHQRREGLSRRRALSEVQRAAHSAAICRHLMESPVIRAAHTLLTYMPTWDEVDLSAFNSWAAAHDKVLAFPAALPDGAMEARVPVGDGAWMLDACGITAPHPDQSVPLDLRETDAVLIPCVGFDDKGGRLGRGGGYYDRLLPRCPQAAKVLAAYEVQRFPAIPREGWDQGVDMAVTELGIQSF